VIVDFLKKEQAPAGLVARVEELILKHEVGGTPEQNILCDADCLAWLEEKAPRNAKKYKKEGRAKKMFEKIDHVISRITSPKAKEKAQGLYQISAEILS